MLVTAERPRHVELVKPGDEGFVVTDIRFSHEYVTPMAAIFFEQLGGQDEKVLDPANDGPGVCGPPNPRAPATVAQPDGVQPDPGVSALPPATI